MKMRALSAAVITGAGFLGMAGVSNAAVVQLTGGDAGQGLTLSASDVIYAVDFGGNGSRTVQGVVFPASNGAITTDSIADYDPGIDPFAPTETSANDIDLTSILRTGKYFDGGNSGKITITGLNDTLQYKVDLLVEDNSGGRTQSIAFNGGPIVDTQSMVPGVGYNFTNLVSSSGGTLIINFTASSNPVFSGLVVSNVAEAIPEPVSMGFLSLGAITLLKRGRRNLA